jgi:ligand-binding sensor domain-containing protein
MLEDRAGNLRFGTFTSGLSRFDGVRWATSDTSSGLPGNRVFDLLETAAGHVWVATDAGVARWDGGTWLAFRPADGIPAVEALQLLEDGEGHPWVRFNNLGVARYDGAAWTRFTAADGLADDRVNDMLRARDGALWFATQAGVSRYDGSAWTSFTTAEGLADDVVSKMMEGVSGAMWFATSGGLSRRDVSGWTTFTSADGLANTKVLVLLEDDVGMIWAGTNTGLSRFDGAGWRTFTSADGLADDFVNVAFKDSRGQLWFGNDASRFGVTRWDGLAFQLFSTDDGLAANNVLDILEDAQGNLWLSTGLPGAGVTRFDGFTMRSWGVFDGLAHSAALAVEADSADVLWIGTPAGLNRFDGRTWRLFASFDGLPGDTVSAIIEDGSGRLWLGTNGGIAVRSGDAFTTVTAFAAPVMSLFQDAAGRIWAGTRRQGVYRFDGAAWTNFREDDGLPDATVTAIVQADDGAIWFGTQRGLARFDGTTWSRFTTAEGLPGNLVHAAGRDSSGALWFGTEGGAGRFDGTTWRNYTENDGLASRAVLAIHVAADGVPWLGTLAGVSRFDGQRFLNFGPAAGLAGSQVRAATSDGRGRLWFGVIGGLSRLEPDRVPPRAVVVPDPARVSASRSQTLSFAAAFGESRGIAFSTAFDGEPWSPWSGLGFVQRSGLADGPHLFAVRARDEFGNLQDPATTVSFEVDATPPAPILTAPSFAAAIRGEAAVTGTASDPRFAGYRVEVRPGGAATWDVPPATLLASSVTAVVDDTLATWDTRTWPDGSYDLRLAVADTLGLVGVAQIRVTVDNEFPFVDQTAPARVVAAQGGHVYTTHAELHLFFPPNGFDRDAVVTLDPVAAGGVPDSLGPGVARLTDGFDLDWAGARLVKPATLEFTYDASALPAGTAPALHVSESGGAWRRIGGTPDPGAARVAATVEGPGRLALFAETSAPQGGGALSSLALTPRVLSLDGRFAGDRIAIGFSLGRAAPVTVKIYNRAGRLVREVTSGLTMGPGANLVYWDGRDRDGGVASEGLYLVTVEAMDERRTQTLAVVR